MNTKFQNKFKKSWMNKKINKNKNMKIRMIKAMKKYLIKFLIISLKFQTYKMIQMINNINTMKKNTFNRIKIQINPCNLILIYNKIVYKTYNKIHKT